MWWARWFFISLLSWMNIKQEGKWRTRWFHFVVSSNSSSVLNNKPNGKRIFSLINVQFMRTIFKCPWTMFLIKLDLEVFERRQLHSNYTFFFRKQTFILFLSHKILKNMNHWKDIKKIKCFGKEGGRISWVEIKSIRPALRISLHFYAWSIHLFFNPYITL